MELSGRKEEIQGGKEKSHILYVDGLRALAALFVVIHHCVLQYYQNTDDINLKWYKKAFIIFFYKGHYAVDLFIVISGYCLMLPLIKYGYNFKNGVKNFYIHRVRRIIPTYYLAMLLSLGLIWTLIGNNTNTHWDVSIPVSFKDVITHMFLVHDVSYSTAYKINHAFWSIAVECRIYLLFPVLIYMWRKFGRSATLFVTLSFSILCFLVNKFVLIKVFDVSIDLAGFYPYVLLFVLGMLAADITNSSVNTKLLSYLRMLPWKIITSLLFIVSIIADWLHTQGRFSIHYVDVIMGLSFAALMITLAESTKKAGKQKWLLSFLSSKPMVFCGMFAYSIYLIHAPFLQVFSQYFLKNAAENKFENTLILTFAGTPVIVLLSYFFFIVCEAPFITKKKGVQIEELEKKSALSPAP